MGLDMYAYKTADIVTKDIDFEVNDMDLIHRWRKHPHLHEWMENLYIHKGGTEIFNGQYLQIDTEDLNLLEVAIQNKTLSIGTENFFGVSDGSELESDLDFINKARDAINQGYCIFYYSWW